MVNPIEAPNSDDKLWAGLSYVGLICCMIPTIVIFLLKRDESRYIKFHALQALGIGLLSLALQVGINVTASILPFLGLILGLASLLIGIAFIGLWVYLIIAGFTGKDARIPGLAGFIDQSLMG